VGGGIEIFDGQGGRRYRVVITPESDEDGDGWIARIPKLPGCMAAADTVQEALELLQEAKEAWIDAAENSGESTPRPIPSEYNYSGKFTLRIPRSLHRELSEKAEAEGVSLNQYCTHLLTNGASENEVSEHSGL